jgi:hypothetical protein
MKKETRGGSSSNATTMSANCSASGRGKKREEKRVDLIPLRSDIYLSKSCIGGEHSHEDRLKRETAPEVEVPRYSSPPFALKTARSAVHLKAGVSEDR